MNISSKCNDNLSFYGWYTENNFKNHYGNRCSIYQKFDSLLEDVMKILHRTKNYIAFYIEAYTYGFFGKNYYRVYLLLEHTIQIYDSRTDGYTFKNYKEYTIDIKIKDLHPIPDCILNPKEYLKPKTVREQLEEIKDSVEEGVNKCCFCQENKACIAFDCGHAKTCAGCSLHIIKINNLCPICRADIKSILHIFL